MPSDDVARDTIAAIATPAGRGGIGVVRVSGPLVPRIGEELATARALTELSHKLVEEAARILEGALGREVELSG